MNLARLAWTNLLRRPFRTVFTVAGVAAAVACFIALTGLVRGLERAWTDNLQRRGVDVIAVRRGAAELLAASFEAHTADQVRALPGVRDVAGELLRLVETVDGTEFDGGLLLVAGWSLDGYLGRQLRLQDGTAVTALAPEQALIGPMLAAGDAYRVGGDIRLLNRRFEVAGVLQPAGVMMSHAVIIPLSAMQRLIDLPGRINVLNIALEPEPNAWPALRPRLEREFPDLRFMPTDRVAQDVRLIRLWRGLAWGVSSLALVTGLVVVWNTMLMVVTERTREIGVLAAVGWPVRRITALLTLETLLVVTGGFGLGVLAGQGALFGLGRMPALRGFLDPAWSAAAGMEVGAVALGFALLGTLYPVRRAARLDPVAALRQE